MSSERSSPAAPVAASPSKGLVFLRRLLSFVVLWSIVLGAEFSGNRLISDYVFLVILVVLTGLGLREFYSLVSRRGLACFPAMGLCGGLLLVVSTFFFLAGRAGVPPALVNDFETAFLILFVLGLCFRQFLAKTNPDGLTAISTTLFGLMYVAWLLNFIQKINFYPRGDGHFFLLYFILVTKFSDTGAYLTGSLIGRHKMIPRISPGKTWEGFGGAILFSTGASLAYVQAFGSRMAGMGLLDAAILGVLLSVTAVVGDLIESLFKREAGVKDSGSLFPGVGGILDLLDSLLFNAPLMYLYMRLVLS